MPPFLRNYQAKNLLNQFDTWFESALDTSALTLRFGLTSSVSTDLEVVYNHEVVYQCHTVPDQYFENTLVLEHNLQNQLNIRLPSNCIINYLHLDNFDLKPFINQTTSTLDIEFSKPFILWYNSQNTKGTNSELLGDKLVTNDDAVRDMQKKLLNKLEQLKF